eukprot:623347-Rhodomonas_salina.1
MSLSRVKYKLGGRNSCCNQTVETALNEFWVREETSTGSNMAIQGEDIGNGWLRWVPLFRDSDLDFSSILRSFPISGADLLCAGMYLAVADEEVSCLHPMFANPSATSLTNGAVCS